jgi:hypothetical protein
MLSTRAGDLTQRLADLILIALAVEKRIDVAQRIISIGDVQEA